MAEKIYSFINGTLPTQDPSESYGAINSSTYRVTSLFDVTGMSSNDDRCACAVCDGVLFVQPQEGGTPGSFSSTMVNMVLKPTTSLSIGGVGIKYFIYRGILKDSLVDSNYTLEAVSALSLSIPSQNERYVYVGRIKQDHDIFNESSSNPPDTRVMGWTKMGNSGNNYNSDLYLDRVFYDKEFDTPTGEYIELAAVSGGDIIGIFSQAQIGFEVVLNDRVANLTLHDFRKPVNILDVTSLTTAAAKIVKEKVHGYLDPATFYSMIKKLRGNVYKTNRFTTNLSTDIPFNNFQSNFIDKFNSKNRIYIDLRNEIDCSLNYWGDNIDSNNKSFSISKNSTTATEEEYNILGWPIYYFTVTPNSGNYYMPVALSFIRTYNPVPLVYADLALNEEGKIIEFVIEKFKPDDTYDNDVPYNPNSGVTVTKWSEYFTYYVPVESGVVLSWYMKLNINRRWLPNTIPNTAYKRDFYLDNVFGPILDVEEYKKRAIKVNNVYTANLGKRYINMLRVQGIFSEFIGELGVVISDTTISFYLNIECIAGDITRTLATKSIAAKPDNGKIMQPILNSDIGKPTLYTIPTSVDNTTVNVLVVDREVSPSTYGGKFALGLMLNNEYEDIYDYADSNLKNNGYESYINFRDLTDYTDPNPWIIRFYSTELHASGVNNSGVFIDAANITSPSKTYTADNFIYSTSSYALTEGRIMLTTMLNAPIITTDDLLDALNVIEYTYIDFPQLSNPFFTFKEEVWNNHSMYGITTFQVIESTYKLLPDSVFSMAKRLRVHYYGNMALGFGNAFSFLLSVDDFPYFPYYYENGVRTSNQQFKRWREVRREELIFAKQDEGANAYDRLFNNNNPMLSISTPHTQSGIEYIDFGHLVYGLESLLKSTPIIISNPELVTNHFLTTPDKYFYGNSAANTGIGTFFKKWNIYHIQELAALIGDLGSAAGQFFYKYYIDEDNPATDPVDTNKLQKYFNDFANGPDLLSDVDGVGIWHAYNFLTDPLNNEPEEVRLSDVLTLYYKGVNYLRPELDHNSVSSIPYYTVEYRWFIYCKYMKFIVETSANQYVWTPKPSSNNAHATYWENMRPEWYLRMYYFIQLWCSKLTHGTSIPYHGSLATAKEIFFKDAAPRNFYLFWNAWKAEDLTHNYDIATYPNPYESDNAYSQKLMEIIGIVFDDFYLRDYVKPRLIIESSTGVNPTGKSINFPT